MSDEKELVGFFGNPRNPKIDELITRLKEVEEEGMILYGEIEKVIGKDPQKDGRWPVCSARKHLERKGIVFKCVTGVGYCRQTAAQIVTEEAEKDRACISRKAGRSSRKLLSVEDKLLTPAERKSRDFNASVLGLVKATLKPSTVKALSKSAKPPEVSQSKLIEFLTSK